MVFSTEKNFNVHVCVEGRDPNKFVEPLNEITTSAVQSNGIVVAEHDKEFCLRLYARDGLENEKFAARIFIDDQMIGHPKVFCGMGSVMGYKIETGVHRRFVFRIPKVVQTESSVEAESLAKMGSIRIEFLTTIQHIQKGKPKFFSTKNQFEFSEKGRPDMKKLFKKSLSVGLGSVVENKKIRLKHIHYDKKSDTHITNKIGKGSELIDTVTINYADYDSLLLMGYISIYNVNHMMVIPPKKLREPHVVDTVLSAIIRHEKSPLRINDLERLFHKYCNIPFEQCYLGLLSNFVSRRVAFQLEENGIVKEAPKEEKKSLLKLTADLLPSLVDPKYLKLPGKAAPSGTGGYLNKRPANISTNKLKNEVICLD